MDIEKVAKLARLQLTEEEASSFAEEFKSIINYFEKISAVNTENVEPMVTPVEISQYLRVDQVEEWEGTAESLANAPEKSGSLFKVPPVV